MSEDQVTLADLRKKLLPVRHMIDTRQLQYLGHLARLDRHVGSLSLPRTRSLTNFLPIQCGFRLTRFTGFTCSKEILLGCVFCCGLFGLLVGFWVWFVFGSCFWFPFAPLHALALSLTSARTDSSLASKIVPH